MPVLCIVTANDRGNHMQKESVVRRVGFALGRGVAAFRRWHERQEEKARVRAIERAEKREALFAAVFESYEQINPAGPVTQAFFYQALVEGRNAAWQALDKEVTEVIFETFRLVGQKMSSNLKDRRDAAEAIIEHHFSGVTEWSGFYIQVTADGRVHIGDVVAEAEARAAAAESRAAAAAAQAADAQARAGIAAAEAANAEARAYIARSAR
jgi:hypothetical protein